MTRGFCTALGLFALIGIAAAAEPPPVSHDGLHLRSDAKVAVAYAKPDIDLSGYDKVMILEPHIAFKKNWKRDHRDLSRRDIERIKRRGASLFRESFVDVLEESGYPVVYEGGPDVLLLRPALIDLDVTAPDVMKPGRTRTYVANAGAVTLFVELYDADSGEILARAIDRKAARDTRSSWRMSGTSVTNQAEARLIFKTWAGILRDSLDYFHGRSR